MRLIDLDAEHDYMLEGKYEVQRADYLKSTIKADRPRGEWIFRREFVEDTPFTGHRCSNCNYWKNMGIWNFCPYCGADMRGEDNETD